VLRPTCHFAGNLLTSSVPRPTCRPTCHFVGNLLMSSMQVGSGILGVSRFPAKWQVGRQLGRSTLGVSGFPAK